MSALRLLQEQVSNYVLHGLPMQGVVVDSIEVGAEQRLQVYFQAYRLRLLEVLSNELPGARALLGESRFESLCRDYIETCPSAHYNLRWYGDELLGFARTTPTWTNQPALLDMLSLEADLTAVFDAPETPLLRIGDVALIDHTDWPTLWLRTQTALRISSLNWNVAALRLATDIREPIPKPKRFQDRRHWVCWRLQDRVRYRELESDEAALIEALQAGLTFTELCDGLLQCHSVDEVPLRAVQLLRRWIDDEWLAYPDGPR